MSQFTPAQEISIDKLAEWGSDYVTAVREIFGVEPDPWQHDALRLFPISPRLALKSCKGPGKGFRLSMMLDTPDGRVRWGDLKPGSRVFAEDGSICRVRNIFPLGTQDIYRVTFDDGVSCEVTGEHLWKVRTERRHYKEGKSIDGYSVVTTQQIIDRGVMTVNRSCPSKQFEIPTQGAAQFQRSDQPLDAYLVGVWLGDGSRNSPVYHKPDLEVEAEIQHRGYVTSRISSDRCDKITVRRSTAAFRAALSDIYEKHSYERRVPSAYRYASIEQRTDVLCGLMDTDGCIGDDSHMEYSTTSRTLAEDVVWLVRSLGGNSRIKSTVKKAYYKGENGEKVDCRDCYRVTVTLPFNPFRIAHKRDRWHMPQARYLTRYIASIEQVGKDEAMCIEVDHPTHCHLANDFVVTHNTAVLAWIGWIFLLTHPHANICVCSVNAPNLYQNLWPELERWHNKAGGLLKSQFEIKGEEIRHREHKGTWWLRARTWGQKADETNIANVLAGLHAPYVMWMLDECGDMPKAVLPACEGIFNGEPIEAHIVMAGNPSSLVGPLYHACTIASDLWQVIEITADPDDPKRTPRVSVEAARAMIRQYGRENPWVLVSIFGKFPPTAFNALIGPDDIRMAMRRVYRDHEISSFSRVFGIDVAAGGDDMTVFCQRQGLQVFPFVQMREPKVELVAGMAARKILDWHADGIFIDLADFGLASHLRILRHNPITVPFAGTAHDSTRFYNKRAEMYWDACQWIKNGGALPAEDEPGSAELIAELTSTTYSMRGDQILLEPKESVKAKLGYSPDRADSLVLTFSEPVSPTTARSPNPAAARIPGLRETPAQQRDYDPFSGYGKN